jgi:hypothetical protein
LYQLKRRAAVLQEATPCLFSDCLNPTTACCACNNHCIVDFNAAGACAWLQEVEDDDEDDAVDDEDVAAEDEELLGAAADLLPALAASMGQDAYAAAFLSLHAEPLLARLRPQQPAALRAVAAGAAAEVAEALGGRISAVVEPLLTLMLRELQTEVRAWQPACSEC